MHNLVKDLAFIIHSDLIYQGFDLSPYWLPNVSEELTKLEQNHTTLLTHLQQSKSHFWGCYFESLFSYAIQHLSSLDIVFEHQQIIRDGKTLGEVDMLVQTPQGQLHQFELAIKFYLQTVASKSQDNTYRWLGPNKNDSFDKKYHRANEHQLQMLATDAGQALLHKHACSSEVTSHLLMFGYLYQHIDKHLIAKLTTRSFLAKPYCDFSLVNSAAIQGYWCFIEDLSGFEQCFIAAQELKKLEWLFPIPETVNTLYELEQQSLLLDQDLATDFKQLQHSLLNGFIDDDRPRHFLLSFWEQDQNRVKKIQQIRLFIVPSSW
ncbi:DUF1853 family protein [Marinomonas agarivorans]|nr:DUF1853 family protein [Marinomonas agarivorans]